MQKNSGCGGNFFGTVLYRVDHVGWRAGPAELAEEAGSGEAVQECFEIEVRSDRHRGHPCSCDRQRCVESTLVGGRGGGESATIGG